MAFIDDMTAEDRARAYDLLAVALASAPTEASMGALLDLAQALDVHCPHDLPLEKVRREFMDLLVVPSQRYVAPYESAFRDDRLPRAHGTGPRSAGGLLMGDATLAVRQAFWDAGVLPERDLPDHIANELRLVGHLWHVEACGEPEHAVEAARQRWRFVDEHPRLWIGELAGKIAERSSTGFYRAVIEVAQALLNAESALVRLERVSDVNDQSSVVEL